MIVYFEDGPLTRGYSDKIVNTECFTIDAGLGYSNCHRFLTYVKKYYPFNRKIYTNFLGALSNSWCWDEEKKMPMIYIRNGNGDWTHIVNMTDKELHKVHNLEKLYINGAFRDIEGM